jgi:hypothetical protein
MITLHLLEQGRFPWYRRFPMRDGRGKHESCSLLVPLSMLVVVGSAGEFRIRDLILHCTMMADRDRSVMKENRDITMK